MFFCSFPGFGGEKVLREVSFYELFSWPDRMLQSVQLITCCRAKPDSYLDGDDRLGGDFVCNWAF